jgi:hypothetical protein
LYAGKGAVTIGVAVDFLDNTFFLERGDYYTQRELRERMQKLAATGVKKFYFRAAPGVAYYPSKVLKMFAGDGRNKIWDKRLITTIHKYDVLGEYVKVCKELGIKIYYWEPIFDTQIPLVHYSPDSVKGKKFGEYPLEDAYFAANRQLYMKHRYADRFPENGKLKEAIAKIKLISIAKKRPRLTKDDITIYVGDGKSSPPLKKYKKDFSFSVKQENGKYMIVLGHLDITDSIIKLVQNKKDKNYTVGMDFSKPGWGEVYDARGNKLNMVISGEAILKDNNPQNLILGIGARPAAWDYEGRSILIHIGDFDRYAGGMPCYALREARRRRLEIAREVLTKYPEIDGIAYSVRTHSGPKGGSGPGLDKMAYGFNDVIVKEYKKRYGIDICKNDFDVEKFLSLRGDFFTEFIGEIGSLVHSFGKEFEVQSPPDGRKINYHINRRIWDGYTIDNFFQIDKWAKKGYVDSIIILGGYQTNWEPEWNKQIKRFYDRLQGTKVKLSFMVQLQSGNERKMALPFIKQVISNKLIDEIILYEEETIFKGNLYDNILSMVKDANSIRK